MQTRTKRRWMRLVAVMGALMLLLAACGEEEDGSTDAGDQGTETPGEADYELIEEGRLTVGSEIPYAPFEYEEGGELTGFDVEVVAEICNRLGLENEKEDWITFDFGTVFQALATNTRFDVVVAAVTGYAPEGTPAADTVAERVEIVDFTIPYYPSLQSLAVDVSANPDIRSVDDLPEGARVGVQRATTGAFYAEENLTPLGVELVSFKRAISMYQQLEAGNLVGIFNDLPVSLDAVKNRAGLEVVEQVETGEEYAIAVSKDNPGLKEAINAALEEMFADGSYAEIYKKYFPEQELPSYASE